MVGKENNFHFKLIGFEMLVRFSGASVPETWKYGKVSEW